MRKPKRGEWVTVTWLDSGIDYRAGVEDRGHPLQVSEACGKVWACEEDPDLTLPKGLDTTTLTLIFDGAKNDSHASLGKIWWGAVLTCRRLVVK